jgi:hypothetical protein
METASVWVLPNTTLLQRNAQTAVEQARAPPD